MADSKLSAAQARLNATKDRQRRRKLGSPLNLADAAIDGLATVGPEMQGQVEAYVRQVAGSAGVDLLRATSQDDG